MITQRIGIIGLSAVAAAVATGLVVWLQGASLPDPATADREGLLRWLVTTDLAEHPVAVRAALLRRCEAEFPQGICVAEAQSQLSPSQLDQLVRNARLLLQQWFEDRVDTYAGLPEPRRGAYLDATIALLEAWQGLDDLESAAARDEHGSDSGASAGLHDALRRRLGEATRAMSPERRRQADQFVAARGLRWLRQALLGKPGPVGGRSDRAPPG